MFNFKNNPIVVLYFVLAIAIVIALVMWLIGDQSVKTWMAEPLTKSTKGDMIVFIVAFGFWCTSSRSSK